MYNVLTFLLCYFLWNIVRRVSFSIYYIEQYGLLWGLTLNLLCVLLRLKLKKPLELDWFSGRPFLKILTHLSLYGDEDTAALPH